jgi:tight adherence protein C
VIGIQGVEDLLPLFVFVGIAIGIWLVLSAISRRNVNMEKRLEKFNRPTTLADIEPPKLDGRNEAVQGIIEKAMAFSKPLMPKTDLEQNRLRVRLAEAGFRSEKAASIFLGMKFLYFITTMVPAAIVVWFGIGLTLWGLLVFVLSMFQGLYFPEFILYMLRKRRKQAIFLSLPDVLDLMVVCVESGLGLDAAMRKVCEEMKNHAPIIVEEMTIANFQLQMGRNRRDVLHDLGVRTGVDDVRSLAAILIQADRFGSSIAQALRVQSDSMRTRRKQLAEEKAAKTAVQLIFPLVLFIFPGIFVVLVGPAAIQIGRHLIK